MFELKVVLTIVITFIFLAAFLGTNETVQGFFGIVGDRFSFGGTARNVAFTLSADNYTDLSFSAKSMVNITVDGDTTASLRTGNLQTNKTLSLYGFQGTGTIDQGALHLTGRIAKIELPEITVAVQESITSTSTFTSLSATNLELKELKIRGTGYLTVQNTTTQFSGDVEFTEPAGTFTINKNGTVFGVSGRAVKITIPGSGIVIQ